MPVSSDQKDRAFGTLGQDARIAGALHAIHEG
jgi:hypothetical protein